MSALDLDRIERSDAESRAALAALLREAADAYEGDRVEHAEGRMRDFRRAYPRACRARALVWRVRLLDAGDEARADKLTGDQIADLCMGDIDDLGRTCLNRARVIAAARNSGPTRSAQG